MRFIITNATKNILFPPTSSVLKTFLHDPLVEWSKPVRGNTKTLVNETGEIVNEKVSW